MSRGYVYEKVTAGILERLEAGVAPWHRPWNASLGRPRNYVTGRAYNGVNAFALGMMGRSPYWMTMNQVNRMGFRVKRGSKGVPILFVTKCQARHAKAGDEDEDEEVTTLSIVKCYYVFNALDVDGLALPPVEPPKPWLGLEEAERILQGIQPRPMIRHGGAQAFFSPAVDYIELPHRGSFDSVERYYSTAFHELTHWTGHKSRLNRATMRDSRAFGDSNYSQEELVAEMGAGFLCALAGIENTIDQNASYLASWLRVLKGEPGMIVRAAAAAQRAVDFLAPEAKEVAITA